VIIFQYKEDILPRQSIWMWYKLMKYVHLVYRI